MDWRTTEWQDIFRQYSVNEVKKLSADLYNEKSSHDKTLSSGIGAKYPEILSISQHIEKLASSVLSHEKFLVELSSYRKADQWHSVLHNVDKYALDQEKQVLENCRLHFTRKLKTFIKLCLINDSMLKTARAMYLLSELDGSYDEEKQEFDAKMDNWLAKDAQTPSSEMFQAYMIRYRVPSLTVLAKFLERRRNQIEQTKELPRAFDLLESTLYTLDYAGDYLANFQLSETRLVDCEDLNDVELALSRNVGNLPDRILDLRLFPDECYKHSEQLSQGNPREEFITGIVTVLQATARASVEHAETLADLTSLYGTLITKTREAIDIAQIGLLSKVFHSAFCERFERVLLDSIDTIKHVEMPSGEIETHQKADTAEDFVNRSIGKVGTLAGPIDFAQTWGRARREAQKQITIVSQFENRAPEDDLSPRFSEFSQAMQSALDSRTAELFESKLNEIGKEDFEEPTRCAGAILIVQSLVREVKATSLTAQVEGDLYSKLCDLLIENWKLDEDKAVLQGFPTRGLLRSLLSFVKSMDAAAVGLEWPESECVKLREKVRIRLEGFGEDTYLDALFGVDQAENDAVSRTRSLLIPLAK